MQVHKEAKGTGYPETRVTGSLQLAGVDAGIPTQVLYKSSL